MGLEEYIRAGANLQRSTITVATNESGSGSIDLASTYALLNISTTAPCRLRLYDTNTSLVDATEISRVFGDTNIPPSIALIADFSMSAPGNYTLDPSVYGVVDDTTTGLTYYRVEDTQSGNFPVLTFTRYRMEDRTVSTDNRLNLPVITASLAANALVSGTLASPEIPRTYLLVSASVSGSDTRSRLRLYTKSDSLLDTTEISRSFATESNNASGLIVDAILSGSTITYFVPKIAGANLQTAGTNLNNIRLDRTAIAGNNELYYALQNMLSTGGTVATSASVHVFSLED